MTSVVTNRDRDCLACRIVSGTGLIGIGGYLAITAQKNKSKFAKFSLGTISLVFFTLGVARIRQTYPFDKNVQKS